MGCDRQVYLDRPAGPRSANQLSTTVISGVGGMACSGASRRRKDPPSALTPSRGPRNVKMLKSSLRSPTSTPPPVRTFADTSFLFGATYTTSLPPLVHNGKPPPPFETRRFSANEGNEATKTSFLPVSND